MQGLASYVGARCPSILCHREWLSNSGRGTLGVRALYGAGYPRTKIVEAVSGSSTLTGRKTWNKIYWRVSAAAEDEILAEEPASATEESEASIQELASSEVAETVQVKFVLQKECHFGQRFNVIGNDPLFGDWKPAAAVPMEWEEGHIWSLELDVPIGKQIEYKFLLTGKRGEIEWQPGPNRVFDTSENVSPLVLSEAWDSEDIGLPEDGAPEKSDEADELLDAQEEAASVIETPIAAGILTTGLGVVAAEEVTESQKSEGNGQIPASDSGASNESETAPEIPLVEAALVSAGVETAIEGDTAASEP